MIICDHEPGSGAWHAERLGKPTASQFGRIVTPKTLKLAAGRRTYMRELLSESLTGLPAVDLDGFESIEHGRQMEPEAEAFYRMVSNSQTWRPGFIYRDESRTVGCSPDWLVIPEPKKPITQGVELKCPWKLTTHLGYALNPDIVPAEHVPQVQGGLWVTGLDAWDFISYYPGQPPVIVPTEPDPDWMAALDEHIPTFLEEIAEAKRRLLDMGFTPAEVTT